MKSKWFEYKEVVLELRKKGTSMTTIEREFGIARSTLSGWFKEVELTEQQRTRLMQNSVDGWKKAREKAVITKNLQKAKRVSQAGIEAREVFESLPSNSIEVLELAVAMLYLGEGGKGEATVLGASDPFMLKFYVSALEKIYNIKRETFRYDLHLRYDQDESAQRTYWSNTLNVPLNRIRSVSKDKRTIGKPTRAGYNGVCQIYIGNIAIQRRLMSLYNVYCSEVVLGT